MSEADCLFCKIIRREISANVVLEDDDILAFRDVNPQAPVHILIMPKKHISRISDLDRKPIPLLDSLFLAANQLARQEKVADSGYRLVINCNAAAGQSVFHLHLHLLGGRLFHWPPG
jgi:histidine triad (HIT) family protein